MSETDTDTAEDGGTITNPEQANEALDALLEQPRAEFDEFGEVQQQSVKQKLEAKREDQARRTVKVLGEPVEFERPGAMATRRAVELRQRVMNGEADAEVELYDYIFETLADHSVDPTMDADWWGDFSFGTLQEVFEDLVLGDLDEEAKAEIEQFRSE